MTTADPLEKGREAFSRRAWTAAYTELAAADRDRALGPADLERLAVTAYLTGSDDESADAWARGRTRTWVTSIAQRSARFTLAWAS